MGEMRSDRRTAWAALFDRMPLGAFRGRVVVGSSGSTDLLFLETNPAFERLWHQGPVAGKRASEVSPESSDQFPIYARVATTGEPAEFERYLERIERWVSISVYSPAKDEFVALVQDITERKRAEQARRASEEWFRSVFDDAAVGMALPDLETGRFLEVNDPFCRMLGYERAELLKLRWQDVTAPEDLALNEQGIRALLSSTGTSKYSASKRYRRKDGSTVWARLSVSRHVTAEGDVRLIAIVEDVTAQHEAEVLSRLQTTALEAAADGVVITDPTGIIHWVNGAVERLTGWTRAELVGTHASRLGTGAYAAGTSAEMVAALKVGTIWRGRALAAHKDGSSHLEELSVTPVFDGEGALTHAVAFKRDVSQEERAQRELHEAHERHALALEAAELGTIRRDYRTGEVAFDARARAYFGLEGPTALFDDVVKRVHPDDVATMRTAAAEMLRPNGPRRASLQYRIVLPSKEVRWLSMHGVVKFETIDGVERPAVGFATMRDITAAKRAEEELRSAQRMEAVGRLAGGIAHDFNNLLGVIMGYTDSVLEQLPSGDPRRDELHEVALASRRAALLTGQLLAFSRKQMLVLARVDVSNLVQGLAIMLRRMLGERIALAVRASPTPVPVMADRGQIEQVVVNLVLNARDAMPDGGAIDVEVSTVVLQADRAKALDLAPGSHALLRVVDNGVGMDDATRARIFEPFFTTKALGKGTGLGLSTVYGIVKQSRGAIEVSSEPGRGTRFDVYLPSDESGAALAEPPRDSPVSARAKGVETILVVEDEPALRAVVERILKGAGYRVACASNADEALKTLQGPGSTPIDLLITDVVMPGLGGRMLADRARALVPGIRVLFMTGYTDEGELHEIEGHQLLRKPFDRSSLTEKVRIMLDEA